jgi:hypothetical protein
MTSVSVEVLKTTVVVASTGQVITVETRAPRMVSVGVQGPPGINGDSLSDFNQTFLSPLLQWTINHNLGREPLVSVKTVGGMEVLGDVIHISPNQLLVNFAEPMAGRVRCI